MEWSDRRHPRLQWANSDLRPVVGEQPKLQLEKPNRCLKRPWDEESARVVEAQVHRCHIPLAQRSSPDGSLLLDVGSGEEVLEQYHRFHISRSRSD